MSETTSQVRLLDVRLGRPQDVILRRPQDVRSRRSEDVSWGHPCDDQIGSLGDVLGKLEGTSSGGPGDQYFPAGICHSIYRYAKINKKYLKDYDKNKESSYHQ